MKSHLPLNKNNKNYFNSKIFNNNALLLPGIEKNYYYNNFVNKSNNNNINNLFNNEFSNNNLNFGIFNNFNSGSCFNNNQDLFNNNIEFVQKMTKYNSFGMNDNKLLNGNYNLNCINNSNIEDNRFITIKNGEEYKSDSINKECGLFNLKQFKRNVFNICELKIENPISLCIIVTDILNL